EARVHFTGDRAAMGTRDAVCRQEIGVGLQLVDIFRDRQGIPDLDPVMGETGDQERRREQKEFGPRGRVVARRLPFLEVESGHFAKQPTGKYTAAVILAGDSERGHRAISRWAAPQISRTAK